MWSVYVLMVVYLFFLSNFHYCKTLLLQTSMPCASLSVQTLRLIQTDVMYTFGAFRMPLTAIFSLLRADASVPLSYRVESGYLASLWLLAA